LRAGFRFAARALPFFFFAFAIASPPGPALASTFRPEHKSGGRRSESRAWWHGRCVGTALVASRESTPDGHPEQAPDIQRRDV
jgi:hypothetical protein